jgi:hypothetical protein
MNKTLPVLAFTATLGFSGAAGAGLIDRGGGLIYDDVLKITWLQDANYGAGSSYDDGLETTDGLMTWQNALNWAANLSYSDSVRNQTLTGWRLPTVEPIGASFDRSFSNNAITDTGYAKTTTGGADGGWRDDAGNPVSEMGHMYYVNLANKGFCTPDDGNPVSCDVGQPQPGWGLLNSA